MVEASTPACSNLTTSASGLDPDISPANAAFQAARVAGARGIPRAEVLAVIADHTDGPFLGFIGQAHVNVLAANLALDARYPAANPNEGFRKIDIQIVSDVGKHYRVRSRPGYRPRSC